MLSASLNKTFLSLSVPKKKVESVSLKCFFLNGHIMANLKWRLIQLITACHLLGVEFAVTITSQNEISKMIINVFKGPFI